MFSHSLERVTERLRNDVGKKIDIGTEEARNVYGCILLLICTVQRVHETRHAGDCKGFDFAHVVGIQFAFLCLRSKPLD